MLKRIKIIEHAGAPYSDVIDVTSDSRDVRTGMMFVAHKGFNTDGHNYIEKAVLNGAKVIVCETFPLNIDDKVCYLKVKDTGKSLGIIASEIYGNPSSKLSLVGVTGTNGKTTIATLLYKLFSHLGYKVGLLSTVINKVADKEYETHNTTPDPITIQRLLKQMVDEGCSYCFMEVSSHGIVQDRIAGLNFKGAIFTNITRDHLDYHKTFGEYIKAKKMFFDNLPIDAFVITNIDDRNGLVMVQNTKAKVKTYSLMRAADYKSKIIESHFDGTLIEFSSIQVWVQLIGKFNAYNLTAIFAAAMELGADMNDVLKTISILTPVSGRFETIKSSDGKIAIVDYAHTPDAVENVLKTISELKCSSKVITVVGCGGDRDKGKRPVMAAIASKYSDTLILTSDNPRTENPSDILNDMLAGLSSKDDALVIEDRAQAIKVASKLARGGDIILIAGKGHEDYQEINGVRYHFDDVEQIKSIFSLDS